MSFNLMCTLRRAAMMPGSRRHIRDARTAVGTWKRIGDWR